MRKMTMILLTTGCIVTLLVTVFYAYRVFQGNENFAFEHEITAEKMYRIVYISQELGSPFWTKIQDGVRLGADEQHAVIDFWGGYRPNLNELIKYMEIAIAAKVSGIIVQGTDHQEFVDVVNKASAKGIPVITIATDALGSLRKTYVGSDHYEEGLLIGNHVAKKMGGIGKVAIVSGVESTSYEKQREEGLIEVLDLYPDIEVIRMDTGEGSGLHAKQETNEILNQYPDCKVFIGLYEEAGLGIIQTIVNRSRVDEYLIYSFEDGLETLDMLEQGMMQATLLHRPQEMGTTSIELMITWLEGRDLPLQSNYYIPSKIISSEDLQ